MKHFTQTRLAPWGNCWQTAIACILEVDPEEMPPQSEIEEMSASKAKPGGGWLLYSNALNGYLKTHHGLVYSEIQKFQFKSVRPVRSLHTLNGPTVRSKEFEKQRIYHINHCVVAKDGAIVWDPHPSRAGLIDVDSWGVLGEAITVDSEREKRLWEDAGYRLVFGCLCPKHNLNELRQRYEEGKKALTLAGSSEVEPIGE